MRRSLAPYNYHQYFLLTTPSCPIITQEDEKRINNKFNTFQLLGDATSIVMP
jgi:hypothetical protein